MEKTAAYSRRLGIEIIDTLLARSKQIFTTEDAHAVADELGILPATLSWALYELIRAGWIQRARRGLYLIDETRRGGPAPHPFAIATALVEPSAISHWSALAYHGLTEQIPRIVTVSTPKDVVTPRMRRNLSSEEGPASVWNVAGLAIRYIRVTHKHFWGFDHIWMDEFNRVSITDRERTMLDGFVSPEVFGSLQEVLGALEEHLADIDLSRLVAYTLRYDQAATIKRLGYILNHLGVSPEVFCSLREAPIRGYRLLDSQGPDHGHYDSTWHIRDNMVNK